MVPSSITELYELPNRNSNDIIPKSWARKHLSPNHPQIIITII